MKRNTALFMLPLAIASIGLAFVCGASVGRRRSEVPTETSTALPAAVQGGDHPLEDQVAALRRELRALQAMYVSAAAKRTEENVSRETKHLPDASSLVTAADRRELVLEALATRVGTETRDTRWSDFTEQQIARSFQNIDGGTKLTSARCAATLCEITVEHTNLSAQHDLVQSIKDREPFSLSPGSYLRYSHDPVPKTTIYVLRQGIEFKI